MDEKQRNFCNNIRFMKRFLMDLTISVEKISGILKIKQYCNRFRLLGLCYHSVVSNDVPRNSRTDIAVTVRNFEQQLALIRERFHPVSLRDIEQACFQGKTLPKHAVFVTFDDGYRNNLTLAAPLLKKYEIPATVFVSTGYIEKTDLLWTQEIRERLIDGSNDSKNITERERLADETVRTGKRLSQNDRADYLKQLRNHTTLHLESPWKRELYEFMTWDEVREIRQFGVTIGAHTVSHPILSRSSRDEIAREFQECRKTMESELGEECFAIAYPNGKAEDFNADVMEEAKKSGFRIGFNLCEHRNPQKLVPMSMDRCCVTLGVSLLEFERLLVRG